jgi:segregation and condensation protein A
LSYEIKLPLFEGPFDLLLFFIERDELNIHDIPIARITDDFLAYLKQLEALNMDLASEFILVAATLMRIKAKLLFPRPQVDEKGNEIDPRKELVQHLLEYKKYKSVVEQLSALEENRASQEVRGNVVAELRTIASRSNVDAELQDLDLYKLLKVYEKVMARYEITNNKPVHTVVQYPYTIDRQKQTLMLQLAATGGRLSFSDVIRSDRVKMAVVYNFLAILDLLQLGQITLRMGMGFNNFWIEKPEIIAEGARKYVR